MNHRVRIVKPRQLLRVRDAVGIGIGVGLVEFLVVRFAVSDAAIHSAAGFGASVLGWVLVPAILVLRYGHRLRSLKDAYLVGCGWGFGFLVVPSAQDVAGGFRLSLAFAVIAVAACGLLPLLFVLLQRKLVARVVIQDGTRCPGCAYNLTGNESRVCPECGRPYTTEELTDL